MYARNRSLETERIYHFKIFLTTSFYLTLRAFMIFERMGNSMLKYFCHFFEFVLETPCNTYFLPSHCQSQKKIRLGFVNPKV